MYYQNYEDYMRSVLGYPMESQNTYNTPYSCSAMPYESSQMQLNDANYSDEIMDLYPDIYKIVNPMVCKICEANTKPISRELIDQMTDEIYLNLESQPEFDTVVNVTVNTQSTIERPNRTQSTSQNSNSKLKKESEGAKIKENREDRQRRQNNTLRDLIRILILNRLLGGFFPNRPPHHPRPPRPLMRTPYLRNDGYYDGYLNF